MSIAAAAAAALAMGALGSLHCAAMCGPLAAMGCTRNGRIDGAAGYLAGRLVSYATLGALMGHLGQHALCILPMNAAQLAAVALTAGPAALRGVSLLRAKSDAEPLIRLDHRRAPRLSFAWLASLLPRRGLGLGLATGLLPCGLLVAAWALAAGTASPAAGAAAMATLAVATTPGLLLPIFGGHLARRLGAALPARVQAFFWIALAAWLAARPLFAGAHCHMPTG